MALVATETDHAEARRARAEAGDFEFWVSHGDIICRNRETRKSYRVTASGSCDCPDAVYRKVLCKHATALRLHLLQTGGVV